MHIEPQHDPAQPLRGEPVRAVLYQRDAAGLEIGRRDRDVAVFVGVEIGKTHIVPDAEGKILKPRRRIEMGESVHRLISVISSGTSGLTGPRKWAVGRTGACSEA